MGQEVSKKVLWVFVFLILAAIAILGVLFIRGYQSGKSVAAIVDTTPTPEPSVPTAQITLELSEPDKDIATTSAKLTINGKTSSNSLVSVTGGSDDAIITTDAGGAFSVPITLTEGLNVLVVSAFTEDGDTSSVTRNVVYTKGGL